MDATEHRAAKTPKDIVREAIKTEKRLATRRRSGMTYANAADRVLWSLYEAGYRLNDPEGNGMHIGRTGVQ